MSDTPKITGWADYEEIKADRDQLRAEVERLKPLLESATKSAKDNARNFRTTEVERIEMERSRDQWRAVAEQLATELEYGPVAGCNPKALAAYEKLKGESK